MRELRVKINLSQQTRGVTSLDRALFAHLSSVTPDVKSGKTRVSSFNHALASARFGKSVDPTCYNVDVGNSAALFDIDRRMNMTITVTPDYWSAHVRFRTPNPDEAMAKGRKVITETHREVAYRLLDELGICGKGKKQRYLSDRHFKKEEVAKMIYQPLMDMHAILADTL